MKKEEINTKMKSILKEKLNSFEKIVKDPLFIEFVKKNISELISERWNRPEPKAGFRYKRDWYDMMVADNTLNHEFFLNHILEIWAKTSSLSSRYRHVVLFVCDRAFNQTLFEYASVETEN